MSQAQFSLPALPGGGFCACGYKMAPPSPTFSATLQAGSKAEKG